METKHLLTILETAGAKEGEGSWWETPEGRFLSLYGGNNGVPISIARGVGVKMDGALVHVRTSKGETYIVRAEDLFAGSVDGATSSTTRKAGFV